MLEFLRNLFAKNTKCELVCDDLPPKPMVERSGHWPKVRDEHLLIEPVCQLCGGNKLLNVHHIVPVSFDKSKELDPKNLITLCEGAHHINCHLLFGHLGRWASMNSSVREDVKIWADKLKNRP
jgi:5-methylcytosine-specific restriction endonuclease McrA